MFSKNTKKLDSVIGVNSVFTGDVNTNGTLRIDGTLEGNVEADCVVLGEKASFKGNIVATIIIVAGKAEGNLKAREIVEIKFKGQVLGDISTNKLLIAQGGILSGKSSMAEDASKIEELQKKET